MEMDFIQLGEDMPGGFFIYKAGGKEEILYANKVVLDIFGCETIEQFKDLTGYTFKGMVYPEDMEDVESSIVKQVSENKSRLDYVEYRIVRRDGLVRWVDDYGKLVNTEKWGDVFYVLIRDITEQHESREENIRRADVIEGMSAEYTSIFLINLETGSMRPYRLQNDFFREMLEGKEKADFTAILPKYADQQVIEEERTLFLREIEKEHMRQRLLKENSYSVSYRSREEDGTLTYWEMSVVYIDRNDKHRYGVMGFRDITEHTLRIQKELADRLNMEMELEKEKHANEIKSAFLFNISHDIRTPMNAIKGFTDLALRHIHEPERLQGYLEKVTESNEHLLSLIDDLLEMSSIDYGKLELKEEVCSVKTALQLVVHMFRPQMEEKQLILEEELEIPDEEVYVDETRFSRIMGNIMGNAVKFTPSGGRIRLSARKTQVSSSGYARYEFEIEDTGIGMSEEFLRRMYLAFEREESSTKSGEAGTGLGLTITKKLLDMMGGSIAVKSKKGVGTVFTIGLPMKLAENGASFQGSMDADMHEETLEKSTGEHRLLLVEDIEINRMLAENILMEAGFLVDSVADGSEAVEVIRMKPMGYYDLILMDIQMPVMNGYEATRAIRAMGREDTKYMPIIALSANAREEDKRMSIESGMNSHVAKPFDIAHLINTINSYIASSKERL